MKTFLLVSGLFLAGFIYLSSQTIIHTHTYKSEKEDYTNALNYRSRFLDPDEWVSPEKAAEKLSIAAIDADKIAQLKSRSNQAGGFMGLLVLLYVGFTWFAFSRKRDYRLLVLGLILAALACLPIGLFAPMLEIAAFERDLNLGEIPINARVMGFNVSVEVSQSFQGDMYFYYQSKSVSELISLLFQQKNWLVGLSILVFSVIFPVSKVLLTLGLIFRPQWRDTKVLRFFVEKSGKWSMADVFVVAVFLAFLAFSNMQVGITTESKVLVGLYFFLGYCLISLFSSTWIGKLGASEDLAVA